MIHLVPSTVSPRRKRLSPASLRQGNEVPSNDPSPATKLPTSLPVFPHVPSSFSFLSSSSTVDAPLQPQDTVPSTHSTEHDVTTKETVPTVPPVDDGYGTTILGRTLARLRTIHESDGALSQTTNLSHLRHLSHPSRSSSSNSSNNPHSSSLLAPPSLGTIADVLPSSAPTEPSSSSSASSISSSHPTVHQPLAPSLTSPRRDPSPRRLIPPLTSSLLPHSSSSLSSSSFSNNPLSSSRLTAATIMQNLAQHTRTDKISATIVTEPSFLPPAVLSSAPPTTVLQAVGSYLVPLPLPGIHNIPTQSLLSQATNHSLQISNSRGSRRSPLVSTRSLFAMATQGISIRNEDEIGDELLRTQPPSSPNTKKEVKVPKLSLSSPKKLSSPTKSLTNPSSSPKKRTTTTTTSTTSTTTDRSFTVSSSSPPDLLRSPPPSLSSPSRTLPIPTAPLPSSPTLLRSLLHRPTTTTIVPPTVPSSSLLASTATYAPSVQYRTSLASFPKKINSTVSSNGATVGGRSQSSPPLPLRASTSLSVISELPVDAEYDDTVGSSLEKTTMNPNDNNTGTSPSHTHSNNRYKRFTRTGRSLSLSPSRLIPVSSPKSPVSSPSSKVTVPSSDVSSPEPVPRGRVPLPSRSTSTVPHQTLSPSRISTNPNPNHSSHLSLSPRSKVHWDTVFQRNNVTTDTMKPLPPPPASTLVTDGTKTRSPLSLEELAYGTEPSSASASAVKANPSSGTPKVTVSRSVSAFVPGRHSAVRAANRASLPRKETGSSVTKIEPPPLPKENLSSPAPKRYRSQVYAHVRSSGYSNNHSKIQNDSSAVAKAVPSSDKINRKGNDKKSGKSVPASIAIPSKTTEASTVPIVPPSHAIPLVRPTLTTADASSTSSLLHRSLSSSSSSSSPTLLSDDEQQLQEELRHKLAILKQEGRMYQSQLSEAKINQETAIADAAIARVEYEESKAQVSTLNRERDAYKLRYQAATAVLEEQNKHRQQEELTFSTVHGIKMASIQNRTKRLENEYTEIQHHIECLQNEVIPELEMDKLRYQNKQDECMLLRKSVTLLQQGKLVNAPKQTRIQIKINQKKMDDEIRQLINDIDTLANAKDTLTNLIVPLREDYLYHQRMLDQLWNDYRQLQLQLHTIQTQRRILREKGYITEPLTLGLPLRFHDLGDHSENKGGKLPTPDELQALLTSVQEQQRQFVYAESTGTVAKNSTNTLNGIDYDNEEEENDDTVSVEASLVTVMKDTETQTILQPPLPPLSGAALVRSVLGDIHVSSLLRSPASKKHVGMNHRKSLHRTNPSGGTAMTKPSSSSSILPTTSTNRNVSSTDRIPSVMNTKEITAVSERLLSALALADKAIYRATNESTVDSEK